MTKSDTGRKARQNGRAFEQAIARDLRKWLGSEWTVRRVKTSYQAEAGGEFEITPALPVAIECKRDRGFKTDQLWKSGVSAAFRAMWSQAEEQAGAVGKCPWLILREPPTGPVLLVMRRLDFVLLPSKGLIQHRIGPLVVVPWAAFLEAVPASALAELG